MIYGFLLCLPKRRRRVSGRRGGCKWACTFHPFVQGTTYVGAVFLRKPTSNVTMRQAAGNPGSFPGNLFKGLDAPKTRARKRRNYQMNKK
jgi:hypothetical protein